MCKPGEGSADQADENIPGLDSKKVQAFFGKLRLPYVWAERALTKIMFKDPGDTAHMRLLLYVWFVVVPFHVYLHYVYQWGYDLKTVGMMIALSTVNYGPSFATAKAFFGLIHLEGHAAWRGGLMKRPFWFLERSAEWMWTPIQGALPEGPRTFHVCMHHKYFNNLDDLTCTLFYDRASKKDFFLKFMPRMYVLRTLGFGMLYHFYLKKSWKNFKRQVVAMVWVYAQVALAALLQPTWLPVIHMLAMQLVYTMFYFVNEWGMHAFIDPLESNNPFLEKNTTILPDTNYQSEAYHLSHHAKNTSYAAKDKYKEQKFYEVEVNTDKNRRQYNCFSGMVYLDLFKKLMKADFDSLAEHLVLSKNVEMSHKEKVELLKRRTRKFDYRSYTQEFLESRGFYGPLMHVE
ncbi:hypothetical protein CYMTET_6715 [Cymbomonas tetramitiformis]|uniref:Fatty acid desaturase n=1 Tax=Cymbomonas tetramitiformis TaxID=36881 RepID=A0AAE0LHM3_9CHLO|nr:hypothetical protein CYMTET_6715 [Cymbomonas tetramitiformis]